MIDILLWIVLALVIAVLAVYALAAFWTSRAGEPLKATFTRLRGQRADLDKIRLGVSGFSAADPEPFGTLAKNHAQQLAEIDSALRTQLAKYAEVQTRYRTVLAFQWPAVLRLPLDAYKLRSDFANLAEGQTDVEQALKAVETSSEKLHQMGWTVAQQVRQSLDDVRSTQSVFSRLQQEGVRDGVLEAAIERSRRWEQSFTSQSPVVVLSGTQEEVLNSSDKALIAKVHELVANARPDIDELSARANEWKQKQALLRKLLAELPERYRAASSGTAQLESAEMHPVQLDISREPLAQARQQIERLGDARKTRTLEEVDSDKTTAEDLISNLKEIEARISSDCEKHKELLAVLSQPDVNTGVEWLRSMVKLADQVDSYDPVNWPRDAKVETLRQDFEGIARLHRALAFEKPERPIQESALDGLLENALKLAGMHEQLRPRAASIEAHLVQFKQEEKEAKESLVRAKALLNQAASVVASCPSLGTPAVDEAEALRGAIDPLTAALDHPEMGPVDEKAREAEALLRKADLVVNRWRDRVTTDLDARKHTLAAKVAHLNEIAQLDDPAIQEASRFIRESGAKQAPAPAPEKATLAGGAKKMFGKLPGFGKEPRSAGEQDKTTPGLAGGIQQIKTMNDELQNCLIALRKVEEVEDPVLKGYEQAEEAREEALRLAARGAELVPEGKTWPPTSLTLVNERGQLALLEDRWNKMKESSVRAIQLVSTLSSLAGEYRAVAGNIHNLVDRIQQDHGRFTELEARLDEAAREWERVARSPGSDATAQEEIRTLIDTSRQEYASLRDRYLRSATSYNQTLQNLRLIVQRMEGTQIEAGDGTFLELEQR